MFVVLARALVAVRFCAFAFTLLAIPVTDAFGQQGLGPVRLVIVHDLERHSRVALDEGRFVNCQGSSTTLRCDVQNGKITWSGWTGPVDVEIDEVRYTKFDGPSQHWTSYRYEGVWKKTVDRVVLDSPVHLTLTYYDRSPTEIFGALEIEDFRIKHMVKGAPGP